MTPFPLEGGRAGDVGARAAVSVNVTGGAVRLPREPSPLSAITPTLDPTPLEGEGRMLS
jgi:hypothetical protein